jgi:hypothetical protein
VVMNGVTNLVRLFPVLMLYFTLKTVGSVHFFRFVITTIDEHALGIKP